jgi:hypothetical protein
MRRQLSFRGRESGHFNYLTFDGHQQGAFFCKRCALSTVKHHPCLNRMDVVKKPPARQVYISARIKAAENLQVLTAAV